MSEKSFSQRTQFPNHWTATKINDLCEFIVDCIHHTPELSDSPTGYFMVRTSDVGGGHVRLENARFVSKEVYEDRIQRGKPQWGDIIISREAPLGNVGQILTNENICLGQRLIHYRPNKDVVDIRYLLFALLSPMVQKQFRANEGRGSIVDNLLMQTAKDLAIPIPPLSDQQKIAAVLSALDAKIELNQRINVELESMAKTLYDYWFVQFDFPNEKGKPYKSAGGKMVWNEELKREIPLGWEVKKFADWIESDKSGDWGKDELEGNYIKKVSCIRGTDINGLNGIDTCNPPTRFILEKNLHKILNSHDLIIEISGGAPTQSTGRLGYVTDAALRRFKNPLICSNFCKAISLKDKKYLYNFVYHWNMLYDNNVFFGYEGKTSGIKNLLFDSFVNSHWTVVPPSEIVDKFYGFMLEIQAKKQTALLESQTLTELRDWLLPMLMNGQVKVN